MEDLEKSLFRPAILPLTHGGASDDDNYFYTCYPLGLICEYIHTNHKTNSIIKEIYWSFIRSIVLVVHFYYIHNQNFE